MKTYKKLLKEGICTGEGLIEWCTSKKAAVKSANEQNAHIHQEEQENSSRWIYSVCNDERC